MTGDQWSDSELLASLPRQPELMGVLYERHALAVFRYLARRAGPTAAEDLLSEVFIAALNARKRVVAHGSGSALPWLYGIAINVLHRYFRRSQPTWAQAPEQGMDWDAVDARLDAEAQRRRLRAALGTLSEADRELLLLVAWEGLTSTEAAAALGISKVAARSRLHRARHRALAALSASAGATDGQSVFMATAPRKEAS
jgi:RNA polymerase sigma-70 factor (ECF subfamily)